MAGASSRVAVLKDDRGGAVLLGLTALVAVVVPVVNLLTPESSAVHLSPYALTLIGKYMCYALLALAVDLVWGYCGILSLGHAAFFSLGGYAMGMYLMRQIGTRGVYGDPVLPDFMVFLNWKALPWFWYGFDRFWFAMLMAVVAPSFLAWLFGWLAFRSRVTGVYLSIITQALTYALMLAFFRNDMGFGGNNGFTDFKDLLGFDLHSEKTRLALLAVTAIALAAGYLSCRAITVSRAGRVMRAIRDAESRTRFFGYSVESYKLWVFVFSAMLAGIAGALYVPQIGIINPSEFAPINSIEVVIWVAVGGRGTLYGAAAGAVLVNYAKTYFTGALPEVWLYALGLLFVLVTLFLPRGLAGLLQVGRARGAAPERPVEPVGQVGQAGLVGQVGPVGSLRREAASASRAEARKRWRAKAGWRMAGRSLRQAMLDVVSRGAAPPPDLEGGMILYVERLTVSFDGFKALNGLTLYVEPGELRCIIGPNGAGKTTMMDVITGKTRPDEGSAWFGRSVNLLALSEPEIAMAGIGRKFQKPTVFEQLTVFENLELALAGKKTFWRSFRAVLNGEDRLLIEEGLEITGLTEERARTAGTLAHGQKQWLEIGMLLMQQPQLLLVDEPVAGMTPQETERTAELLTSLAGKHSVIVVEHDMDFVRSIARRVTVLHEGRVLAEGTMDEVQNDQKVVEVYLGA